MAAPCSQYVFLPKYQDSTYVAPEGKRRRGRPRETWRRTIKMEREYLGFKAWREAKVEVKDRIVCRRRIDGPILHEEEGKDDSTVQQTSFSNFASLRSFSVCQRGRCIIFENLSMSFRLQITRKALLPPTDIVYVSVEAWNRVPFYFRIILSSVAEIKL